MCICMHIYEIKISNYLISDKIILYVENHKEPTKPLLDLISEFSKVRE